MKPSQALMITVSLLLHSTASIAGVDETRATTDFSRPEANEINSGGATTHSLAVDRRVFSHPSSNMSVERRLDFTLGRAMFKRIWVSAPTATQAADGLGPLFNARSCLLCHKGNGRGRPLDDDGDSANSLVMRLSIPPHNEHQQAQLKRHMVSTIPEPTYGGQLQNFAVRGVTAEGQVRIDYEEIELTLADNEKVQLRKPSYSITDLGYGAMQPDTMISPRIAPQMIGLGLLGAIEESDLEEIADPYDRDGDGISGRLNRVWSPYYNKVMPGRFGWKAGTASVDEQSQSAFFGDIGISVPLHNNAAGDCTEFQITCQEAPDGNSPQYENLETPSQTTRWTALYTRNLAVPQRREPGAPEVLSGKQLFYEVGCIDCHKPKFITAEETIDPEHARQLIWPYTDLLLHDMGEGLADNRPEGEASGREWRTAPLWGIGLSARVNDNSYFLHDGRARTLLEAILWHGGEAQASRDKVVAMNRRQRAELIRFIESL
ncbi:MAG: di-heme oxidoredictase family protein [Candidatus Thiodiazotropha endolucinida]